MVTEGGWNIYCEKCKDIRAAKYQEVGKTGYTLTCKTCGNMGVVENGRKEKQ
jgi:hypothetical protein